MIGLKKAIERFQESQLGVYKQQPKRIARDAQAARKATGDHIGRWLFEIVQNAEDAQAHTLVIHVTNEAVYIADDGRGFSAGAIESISGTDYSDKSVETIGRKGVGFKAVYEISDSPQVFTGEDEGVEFSQKKTAQWFADNGLTCDTRTPYEWIPFFASRRDSENSDLTLRAV